MRRKLGIAIGLIVVAGAVGTVTVVRARTSCEDGLPVPDLADVRLPPRHIAEEPELAAGTGDPLPPPLGKRRFALLDLSATFPSVRLVGDDVVLGYHGERSSAQAILDGEDGRRRWVRVQEGMHAADDLAFAAGVFVQGGDGHRVSVARLDMATGEILTCVWAPAADDDDDFFTDAHDDEVVVAAPPVEDGARPATDVALIDVGTGSTRWTREVPTFARGVQFWNGDVLVDGLELRRLAASDGAQRWRYEGPSQHETREVLLAGGTEKTIVANVWIEADGLANVLVGVDPATGDEEWYVDPDGWVDDGGVQLVGNVLLVELETGADHHELVGFDADTGDELWRLPPYYLVNGAVLGDRLLFAGGERGLVIVDARTGEATTVFADEDVPVTNVDATDTAIAVTFTRRMSDDQEVVIFDAVP